MSTLVITHLSHDIAAGKSVVSFTWSDDPNKRLGLEVPYGTTLETVETAARDAITALSRELGEARLQLP